MNLFDKNLDIGEKEINSLRYDSLLKSQVKNQMEIDFNTFWVKQLLDRIEKLEAELTDLKSRLPEPQDERLYLLGE